MATIELFDSSDNCSQEFRVLPRNTVDRIKFESANTAMNTICGTAGCRRRISRFVRCLPVSHCVYCICSLFGVNFNVAI